MTSVTTTKRSQPHFIKEYGKNKLVCQLNDQYLETLYGLAGWAGLGALYLRYMADKCCIMLLLRAGCPQIAIQSAANNNSNN